jgi:tRNA (guanine37-N1)-methyltransferase
MIIDVLTLFPEMFTGPFASSMIGRARERGLVEISLVNIRDYAPGKHRTVDDAPYGGGSGMVMQPGPIWQALDSLRARGRAETVVLLCPQGVRFDQELARALANTPTLALICGHYEGVDERVRETVDLEVSVGDFVVTGGEIPAMLVVDAVCRLIPGVLGGPGGAEDDSFASGLLEYPQYTRPRNFRGLEVPEVLLSGHHQRIARWRRQEALVRTLVRRPELIDRAQLEPEDREVLRALARRLQALDLDS